MIFIQNGAILGNSNVYIFLDINHAITRGLHRPGSRGGGGGLFKICITGNNRIIF